MKLNDIIPIRGVDLSPPPSRVSRAFAKGTGQIDLPAADLIALAVQDGDDTAADVIMGHIGGPGAVTAWLQGRNIKDMRVDRYRREVQTAMFGMESFRPAWKDETAWAAAIGSIAPTLREAASAPFSPIRATPPAPGGARIPVQAGRRQTDLQRLDRLACWADGAPRRPGGNRSDAGLSSPRQGGAQVRSRCPPTWA